MKLEAFRIIALYDPTVWKYLRTLNRKYAEVFSMWNYEQVFRTCLVDDRGTQYNLDGQHHRSDGPAVISINGDEYWYKHGKPHRVRGPAIDTPNCKVWKLNDAFHRLDGPAVYRPAECKEYRKMYYIHGHHMTKEAFHKRIRFYKKIRVYKKMLADRYPDDHILNIFPFSDVTCCQYPEVPNNVKTNFKKFYAKFNMFSGVRIPDDAT